MEEMECQVLEAKKQLVRRKSPQVFTRILPPPDPYITSKQKQIDDNMFPEQRPEMQNRHNAKVPHIRYRVVSAKERSWTKQIE